MSYFTHGQIATDGGIRLRVAAAAAQERVDDPLRWTNAWIWKMVGSDWIAAWESAVAAGKDVEVIGDDAAVITDQMILSATQSAIAVGG